MPTKIAAPKSSPDIGNFGRELELTGATTGQKHQNPESAAFDASEEGLGENFDDKPRRYVIPGMNLGCRTKQSHPYSYDPILVYTSGKKGTSSAYSDHFNRWYGHQKVDALMKKHFANTREDYTYQQIPSIQAFLRELMSHPELELTRIEEQCDPSSGYPLWFFEYIPA